VKKRVDQPESTYSAVTRAYEVVLSKKTTQTVDPGLQQ